MSHQIPSPVPESFSTPFDHRLTRLYTPHDLQKNISLLLSETAHHYVTRVLRHQITDHIILFNGRDGEWLAQIHHISKKQTDVHLIACRRLQPRQKTAPKLMFAPLKKAALDFLIEKAVELGVSSFSPVITDHTMTKRLNHDRLENQILEAVSQCERLTIPDIMPACSLKDAIAASHASDIIWWASEAGNAPSFPQAIASFLPSQPDRVATSTILIGPEGGFSEKEQQFLSQYTQIYPVSLGAGLLRAETAALAALSCLQAVRGVWSERPDFRSISAQ